MDKSDSTEERMGILEGLYVREYERPEADSEADALLAAGCRSATSTKIGSRGPSRPVLG